MSNAAGSNLTLPENDVEFAFRSDEIAGGQFGRLDPFANGVLKARRKFFAAAGKISSMHCVSGLLKI